MQIKSLVKNPSWSFWGTVIGIIGFCFAAYTYLYKESPQIEFEILTNTNVVDVTEDISKLDIFFNNQKILTKDTTLKIITISLINNGSLSITKNLFDENFLLGFEIKNGSIVDLPTVIESSNSYVKKAFNFNYDSKKLLIQPMILDKNDFVTLKLLVVGLKGESVKISSLGKIAGQKSVPIISKVSQINEESFWDKLNEGSVILKIARFFYYAFIFSTIVLLIFLPVEWLNDKYLERKSNKKIKQFKTLNDVVDDKYYDIIFELFNTYSVNVFDEIINLNNNSETLSDSVLISEKIEKLTYRDIKNIGVSIDDDCDLKEKFKSDSFFKTLLKNEIIISESGTVKFDFEFISKVNKFKRFVSLGG